ncbi:FAD/NAD(P)-binding domain-containing protein [Pseudovirgaria hyperparasitica]|uniref:FAD/NAD(P)-binding domain-containing protein n=1 Tax=Pseudovirgaria hyperparasitica TaxID=470096 RepID=A0A6A6VR17_9PEZI|nr:FAD/NAD(P)-binding domain-containing protein [Pseudovirgaria hyperparasitica]KAF2753108.1 FAD/NAD(P)-binding domain-containing protein [Pseudovirgaria hyperparasitica]
MSKSIITPPDSPARTDSHPHRILVVGGSYAGVSGLVNLLHLIDGKPNRPSPTSTLPDLKGLKSRKGVQVTLLDRRDGFFHTVGAPLAHVSPSHVRSSWRTYRSIRALRHPNFTFVQGYLKFLDPESLRATYLTPSGDETCIEYDYLLLCTGLKRDWPIIPRAADFHSYVADAEREIKKIQDAKADATGRRIVVIVGGGAVGIEFAAEIKLCHPHVHVTLVHSRHELLSSEDMPAAFKQESLRVLRHEGVDVVLGQRACITHGEGTSHIVTLSDGTAIHAGHVINATGKTLPSSAFLPAHILDEHGFVKAEETLSFPPSSPHHARHYAAGDICAWSGVKRAGTALVMAHVAATNIMREILLSEKLCYPSNSHIPIDELSLHDTAPATPPSARSSLDGDNSSNHEDTAMNKNKPSQTKSADDEPFGPAARFPAVPPMMGLAVGRQAVSWNPYAAETRSGVEVREMLFGEDLGWRATLKCLGLDEELEV